MTFDPQTKKREKAEDFIGWKSSDAKLEVIGISGKNKWGAALFKVTCTECSKDKELFPDGYFVSTKSNLLSGKKPCGCSSNPQWTKEQFIERVSRLGKEGSFAVIGLVGQFKNAHSRLKCKCLIDNNVWEAKINNLLNGRGCPECKIKTIADLHRNSYNDVFRKCKEICDEMNYVFIGFPEGYKNQKSYLHYTCKTHGDQCVRYDSFVNQETRCPDCWKEKLKTILRENGNGNGYYPERKDEKDFLYVLNFNNQFIKVGRSFDVDDRIDNLKTPSVSGIKNIIKLRIFTATHQEIYDYEQELHEELRKLGFQYHVSWSNECFENNSLFILNKLLDNCEVEELKLKEEI